MIYTVAANVSIASLNLSLMINSVGFYQIAKLLIIPFTAVVEAVWLGDRLSGPQTAATAAVLLGVAIVYASPCPFPLYKLADCAYLASSRDLRLLPQLLCCSVCPLCMLAHPHAPSGKLAVGCWCAGWFASCLEHRQLLHRHCVCLSLSIPPPETWLIVLVWHQHVRVRAVSDVHIPLPCVLCLMSCGL